MNEGSKKIKVKVVTIKSEDQPKIKKTENKKSVTEEIKPELTPEVGVNKHLNPAISDVYVIDFDKIQTIDDIKRILKALDLSFLETTPGFFNDVKDLFKLKEPKKIKK